MKKNIIYLLVFFIFAFIFFIFLNGLNESKKYIPKQVKKRFVVEFSSKDLLSNKKIFSKDYISNDKFTVINIWSSWCVPCRSEHKYLMSINQLYNVNLIGINYKDKEDNAKKFLKEFGNPFNIIFIDKNGILSIELGAYGVPETLIVNQKNEVIKKFIGPLNKRNLNEIKKIIN